MLPGNPNGMIFLKVVTEDGATKTIRCEPSTTIAEIKEQFSYRFDPNEHRICFADGRVGDESTSIATYNVEQNAFIYLRNKNLTQRRGSTGPRPAWADTGAPNTVIGEKPVPDEPEPTENEKGHMSKLRQFISHFLKRRPSPQQLVDAKILKEAPVVATNNQPNYEDIQRCIDWLRKYAMHMEGVFRVSGSAQDNTTFCDKLVNHKLDIEQFTADQLSPHAVTTGLKIYLREKTCPVISYKHYKDYMDNYRRGDKSAEAVRQNCQRMISSLSENNRRILVSLCKFLHDLAQFESENKMNPHNLGVVFGPTLMRTETTGLESLSECDSQIAVVEELIVHINEVDVNAVSSPDTVPSACGSSAPVARNTSGINKPASSASAGVKSPPTMLTAPPMLSVPKNGSRVIRSSTTFSDTKKPPASTTPPPMLTVPGGPSSSRPGPAQPGHPALPAHPGQPGQPSQPAHPLPPNPGQPAHPLPPNPSQPAHPLPPNPSQPVHPGQPAQPTSPTQVAPTEGVPAQAAVPPQGSALPGSPKPNGVRSANSPPSNPPVQALPPGSRPPTGAAPLPGKPPVGHAPIPANSPSSAVQQQGSKLKLVPKFKVNVRGNTGASTPVQTPTSSSEEIGVNSPVVEGLQGEIVSMLMSPNDLQKTKMVATQLSNMFEQNPQEASNILAADPALTAGFILLLGRSIAVSSN